MKQINDTMPVDPQCAAAHVAPWLAEPTWLAGMVDAYRGGKLLASKAVIGEGADGSKRLLYTVDDDGIATFQVSGPVMRGESKFGGTSSVRMRRATRMALADPDVQGGMVLLSTPGGTVAGTDEYAADLRAFGRVKPLHAHGEGVVASAGYWLGIQAQRFTASRMTDIGSIGVLAIVRDTSGAYAAEGIKVHVVSSGPLKGAFADGAEVKQEHLDYLQENVDQTMKAFRSEVMARRNMDAEAFDRVKSGRVWMAPEARALGLIDEVTTLDRAYSALRAEIGGRRLARQQSDRKRAELRESLKS